jgi:YidC/Oxa1 family membrane protein insertase
MEKRVLLAVTLSFLVLVVYQTLVPTPKRVPPPRPTTPAATQGQATTPGQSGASGSAALTAGTGAGTSAADSTPSLEAAKGTGGATAAANAPRALVGDAKERDIVVDTTHVRAVFSTRGAVLKSWALKHYPEGNGQPIDIIPSAITSIAEKPFALSTSDAGVTDRLQQGLYKPDAESLTLGDRPGTLTFEFQDANGLSIRKTFDLQPDGKPYVIRVTVNATLGGTPFKPTMHGGAGIGDLERSVKPSGFFASSSYQLPEAIFQQGRDVHRVHFASIAQQPAHEGQFAYAGIDDHYFLAALIPPANVITRVEYRPVSVVTALGPRELVDYRVRVGGEPRPMEFFYGPKDFDILQGVDRELVRAIHFGWFSFLAVPLLRSLKWVNAFVGNYGWSIILLTVMINLLMFPLRHKSVVSMRKMQEIQPQVKAIQDRYSKLGVTDPARQKMNTELMNLYRERGVNPASGCVPMLMTMPVLLAFYALLQVAIELRGAPFTLWIHDLSAHDPYYVTPVLMGATQFWQTKMTPMSGDPTQQRMMMFMPLMFMVFFLWAPSGLVLYWFVSNLWTIGQQMLTNRLIGPPGKPPAGTVPAEKRIKRTEEVRR